MIGFVGLTHLGIVSCITAASKGFNVIGVDPDLPSAGLDLWDRLPEPGLRRLASSVRGRVVVSSDMTLLHQCTVVFLSLDIPISDTGQSTLITFHRLFDEILNHLPSHSTLVILSQVPPGTTRACGDIIPRRCPNLAFTLFYQMEALIIGAAIERSLSPERIIVGCSNASNSPSGDYLRYLQSFDCPILTMSYESAELSKEAVNCFLISAITTTNFLAEICETVGASWPDIATGLQLDRRIGPHAYLKPGLGLGGCNLLRDLIVAKTISDRHGVNPSLVDAWLVSSTYYRNWVIRRLHDEVFRTNHNPVIAIWGLAYKPDTASTLNSPALFLLDALGALRIQVYDPIVTPPADGNPHLQIAPTPLDSCRDADVLVVMTPWPEFSLVSLLLVREMMRNYLIIDPFAVVDRDEASRLGFRHLVRGLPTNSQEPSQ